MKKKIKLLILALVMFLLVGSTVSAAETNSYIHANGQLLAKVDENNEVSYYHNDYLGSPRAMTNASGDVVWKQDYYPFGSVLSGGVDRFRYTGKELDEDTGLYYYGARYYDSEIGRFVSADKISRRVYDPQSLNRYAYGRDNPFKYVDIAGRQYVSTTSPDNDLDSLWYVDPARAWRIQYERYISEYGPSQEFTRTPFPREHKLIIKKVGIKVGIEVLSTLLTSRMPKSLGIIIGIFTPSGPGILTQEEEMERLGLKATLESLEEKQKPEPPEIKPPPEEKPEWTIEYEKYWETYWAPVAR